MNTGGHDFKARVLQAVDIIELIGQTVALKRRGKDYVGLCPFHQENTPSFHVSPSRQFFHCYGCKAGGNAIDFVMRRDRIEFMDALRHLAERAGIDMPRSARATAPQDKNERQLLLEMHSAAAALFGKWLSDPATGGAARQYLENRGFTPDSIQRFQIGVAPDAWDALLTSAVARKYSPAQLAQAGLAKIREAGRGYYDTFRNRLMFPIRDETGRIIAFGGRIMPGSQDPAKYLNSPETPLFAKSRCIYGLDLARQRAVETRTLSVVEGYTDVVMAHQFGLSNVVSVLGTALTEQHVSILRRFADRIVLLFDPDTAGESAVNRAVELFLTQPVEILIASLPDGLDPDEFLLKHGAGAFEAVIGNAADALSYKWRQLRQRYDPSGEMTLQHKAVEEYLGTLADARGAGPVDTLRWGVALARVAKLTGIPEADLHRRFRAGRSRRSRIAVAPAASAQANSPTQPTTVSLRAGTYDEYEKAERWLLGRLLLEPARRQQVQQEFDWQYFTNDSCRKLAERYWAHPPSGSELGFAAFLADLADPQLASLAVELLDEAQTLTNVDWLLNDCVQRLVERRQRLADKQAAEPARMNDDEMLRRAMQQARRPDLRRLGIGP